MNIYFISGLGADRQAFDKIKLSEHFAIHHIDWLDPLKNEALPTYAKRMMYGIDRTQPFILAGLSFGGILCIEIDKLLPASKIFLISSISQRGQLPWYLRMAGSLRLHRMGFISLLKKIPSITNWAFGAGNGRLKNYLQAMIDKTSDNYLHWSLDTILAWKQTSKPNHVIQIHGTADKLFPIKYIKPDFTLTHGSHFMIVTHADKISEIMEGFREG
jgi:pimeloyl-ACP methyl ester carboxylesterase